MPLITYTYQLLVMRNQFAPLEVEATCAEEACQLIKRSFSGQEYGMVEINMARDLQDTWLVMRTAPFEYCNFLHIESWDGQRFRSFGKGEVGSDIIAAVHHCAPDYFVRPELVQMNRAYATA